jgi:hypothetical protein
MAGDVKSRACVKLEISMFASPGLVSEQISDFGDFFQSFLIASGTGVGGGNAHERGHGVVTRPAGDISAAPLDAELPRLAGRVAVDAVPIRKQRLQRHGTAAVEGEIGRARVLRIGSHGGHRDHRDGGENSFCHGDIFVTGCENLRRAGRLKTLRRSRD